MSLENLERLMLKLEARITQGVDVKKEGLRKMSMGYSSSFCGPKCCVVLPIHLRVNDPLSITTQPINSTGASGLLILYSPNVQDSNSSFRQ